MDVSVDKKAGHCDELQEAKTLYLKVKRITDKGRDAKIKKKKDGRLCVYQSLLNFKLKCQDY